MSLAAEALSPRSCIDQADSEGGRRAQERARTFPSVFKFTVTWHEEHAVFPSLGWSKALGVRLAGSICLLRTCRDTLPRWD
jgi:hypothetical protein